MAHGHGTFGVPMDGFPMDGFSMNVSGVQSMQIG